MKTIEQSYEINAPAAKVWEALVNPKLISAWGGGPAKMDAKVGTKFSLWGGDIFGQNLEVVPEKLLVQEWSDGRLDQPTEVRFELSDKAEVTTLRLIQSHVPNDRLADLADGWKDYYLGPLKDLLEN